ncbi:hypothetical protein H8E88_17915 [candidate division KSB1 bacterium]|nr:hypothetical protein [candidate division KSB1 bacterium]
MRPLLVILIILIFASQIMGQFVGRNQMEFTKWDKYDRTILENWTDLSYQRNFFQSGLRYEINRPPDPFIYPIDTLLKEYELTFAFAEFAYKNLTARVGNYYSMFGRGLILRTYEDRNLRVDNNIMGAQINMEGAAYKIQTIAGKMRDKYNRRRDWIYGVDGEFNPTSGFQIGSSYIGQLDTNKKLNNIGAIRFSTAQDWFDFYGEIAKSSWSKNISYYLASNIVYSNFALTMEYKDYNQLSFKNHYRTEYNAAPSLTKEHSYTLLNRHPHALNMNDEKGYQVELTYTPRDDWEFMLNHSQTFSHDKNRIFEEYFSEIHHYLNESIEGRLAFGWNYDFTTNTNNITPVFDVLLNISSYDQLHLSYQHQHTINKFDKSEYDNEFLLMEYSKSPYFSIALVGEYTNKYQLINVNMDRHIWLYGQVSINYWTNHRVSILYGSRQAGFVCVGGICRYEPEFEGIEIQVINRF